MQSSNSSFCACDHPKALPLDRCSVEWVQSIKISIAESSYVKYISIINNHIIPYLGSYFPEQISNAVVTEFITHLMDKKGLSAKTTRDILVVLGAILKFALDPSTLASLNAGMVYPKLEKKRVDTLSHTEQAKLLLFLLKDMDSCKFGILLALMTGLRIGEVCALRWKDISLENHTLFVHATMQRISTCSNNGERRTKIIITNPKTENSIRVIPLSKTIEKMCGDVMPQDPNAFVLTGTKHYMEPRTLQYRLKAYANKCGINHIHFHMLRHTFATRCVEVDFEIKSLCEILGHSSSKITLDLYVHPSLETKRKNMEKLDASIMMHNA